MSTLATADLGPSDDEADGDFVPAAKPKRTTGANGKRVRSGSDSDSDSDSDSGGEDEDDDVKRLKTEAAEAEAAERKRRAAEAFRLMQEEARAPGGKTETKEEAKMEMVEVRIPRRFAGETIFETVMLPKDHPDAVKYAANGEAAPVATAAAPAEAPAEANGAAPSNPPSNTTDTTPSAPTAPGPPLRRPMRKRPRQSLEAMAAAIDAGKKMTTLEKSQMDWNSHMSKETKLAEEVAQNRRSGGFLEKQAFLDRVGQRRAGMGDGGASGGRRRQ